MNLVVAKLLLLWEKEYDAQEDVFWIVLGVIEHHSADGLWSRGMPGYLSTSLHVSIDR
jgi:hypothetical protein